jgi:peptidoglycan/xylan/chitin deacetylase (PgdA/CDA1 family)
MIGRATIKRTIKQTTGWAALLSQPFAAAGANTSACIFYYHRVTDLTFVDSRCDDWNVTPGQFERQIAELTRFAEIVPLGDLRRRLHETSTPEKILVSLTFDDGYANFHSEVLPILKRYQAPATAFVVTDAVGTLKPLPFDHWAIRNFDRVRAQSWRPLTWHELEECVASGLVTVGAHSHRHLRGSLCTPAQMAEEAGSSREIIRRRLGADHTNAYAYPYGNTKLGDVNLDYVKAVKSAGYQVAVTTDLGRVDLETDPHCLPRLEAHMMDTPGVIRAKAMGALFPYRLTDHLRGVYRR